MLDVVDNSVDNTVWNGIEEDGSVGSDSKMKALTVKMETVTPIGRDR